MHSFWYSSHNLIFFCRITVSRFNDSLWRLWLRHPKRTIFIWFFSFYFTRFSSFCVAVLRFAFMRKGSMHRCGASIRRFCRVFFLVRTWISVRSMMNEHFLMFFFDDLLSYLNFWIIQTLRNLKLFIRSFQLFKLCVFQSFFSNFWIVSTWTFEWFQLELELLSALNLKIWLLVVIISSSPMTVDVSITNCKFTLMIRWHLIFSSLKVQQNFILNKNLIFN